MEDSLGILLFHVMTFQWDVLYPATLGKQQVCSWRKWVDIGSRGGSNRWWHTAMVDTYKRSEVIIAVRLFSVQQKLLQILHLVF